MLTWHNTPLTSRRYAERSTSNNILLANSSAKSTATQMQSTAISEPRGRSDSARQLVASKSQVSSENKLRSKRKIMELLKDTNYIQKCFFL
jgi:hypothetical protein